MDHGKEGTHKAELLRRLLDGRLLIATGVAGVFGRGPQVVEIVARLEALIEPLCRRDGAERLFFPPVTPREVVRRTGYMEHFPHLCGSVHAFGGDEKRHTALVRDVQAGADWKEYLEQTDVVLTPAACYPLYPTLAGTLPEGGRVFDFTGYCFRNEPSDDPARMQAFQVREGVCAGTPEEVRAWRDTWKVRGLELLESLGLPVRLQAATDPFFGRGGRLMKANQEELELKFELVVPIWSEASPTAVASFNYHQEHFGQAFDIRTHAGRVAHTACLGFGLDRITVALLRVHGLEPERWPEHVRGRLWP